jgi:hypothetical protein
MTHRDPMPTVQAPFAPLRDHGRFAYQAITQRAP